MSDKWRAVLEATQALDADAREKQDSDFNNPTPKDRHETAYTTILDAYAANISDTLKKKSAYKTKIFWLSLILLATVPIGLVMLLLVLICSERIQGIWDWASIIVPAVISFLTVFIVIPRIITEYLFNAEEEKYMSEIIKNIQNYDKPA